MNDIDGIFKLLEDWRKLPAYQLERRADIYFAYFLPEIIREQFNLKEDIKYFQIIPELPLRKTKNEKKYGSVKVDYAVFTKETLYLIELKTTLNSLDIKQVENLKKKIKGDPESKEGREKSRKSPEEIIGDIYDIRYSPNSNKTKYKYLLNRLRMIPGVCHIPDIDGKKADICVNQSNIEIVYILPINPKSNSKKAVNDHVDEVIDFFKVRTAINNSKLFKNKRDRKLVKYFCASLKKWEEDEKILDGIRIKRQKL